MSKIKIGLAGFGRFSELVLLNIFRRAPWDLVAIADNSEKRRDLASKLSKKSKIFEDYREIVSLPDVDAVFISLPNHLHADAAILAFAQNKHVYLEKPIAINAVDAKNVVEAWQQSGKIGMVGLSYRFHPLNQAAKKYLSSDKLQDIFYVRSSYSFPKRNLPKWQKNPESGGGALPHLATHHIDLIRYMLDAKVKTVFSNTKTLDYTEDTAFLQLIFDNGVTSHSYFSHSSIREDVLHFYGKNKKLTINRYHSFNLEFTDPNNKPSRFPSIIRPFKQLIGSPFLLTKIRYPNKELCYEPALAAFANAVTTNTPPSPNLWDGYYSFLVAKAAEKSAKTGMAIDMGKELAGESFTHQ